MSKSTPFYIVAGTYEKHLLGFSPVEGSTKKNVCLPEFALQAHKGCVKAVACCERFLVSGGTDDTISIYDMKKRTDIGQLFQHDGTITCLEFIDDHTLLSGSEDGTVCVWRTSDYECLSILKAHKNHVTDLSVHPSGKIALSVGKDRTIRVWDLIDGKCALTHRKVEAEAVEWNPNGEEYATTFLNKLTIHDLVDGPKHTLAFKGTILTMCYFQPNILAVGGEDKTISLVDTSSGKIIGTISNQHEKRIKGLTTLLITHQKTTLPASSVPYLVSVSSDGCIRIWSIQSAIFSSPADSVNDCGELVWQHNSEGRLTCVCAWPAAPKADGVLYDGEAEAETEPATAEPKTKKKKTMKKGATPTAKTVNKTKPTASKAQPCTQHTAPKKKKVVPKSKAATPARTKTVRKVKKTLAK